ncbi:MAG: substrate-binding domain-containing protein [Blastocatellia bacterium]|nr:substrate-binding domain-containing protein [Blastocatellia bacterium]
MKIGLILFLIAASTVILGCRPAENPSGELKIVSGSENKSLEPMIQEFARANGLSIKLDYKGSVDIMAELQNSETEYDAVWPANRLWITLGDEKGRVKRVQSIMSSPIVFAIKYSLARDLGFIGKPVEVKDIVKAVRENRLRFGMTSASQSNSGAMAYLSFLNTLSGNTDALTMENLRDPKVTDSVKVLLSGVNRSSGSSEFLKELFLKDGGFTAMVNYEAMIIETNQELVRSGREPLYVIYPRDSVPMADSPLGFVDRGIAGKEESFNKLQTYLLSQDVQKKLVSMGRRTGVGGSLSQVPAEIFKSEWGIDAGRIITPIRLPQTQVIREALRLYQSEFRKPSFTVFCLDYSGSMQGQGSADLKQAMKVILDPELSRQYLLQPSSADVIVVIPFNSQVTDVWRATGGQPVSLRDVLEKVESKVPQAGTDIYSPAIEGLNLLAQEPNLDRYIPSVVLMTDGESNEGKRYSDLEAAWNQRQQEWSKRQLSVPIYAITFGSADPSQLKMIADLTRSRVFDGTANLIDAFKKVRGYS